MIIITPIIFNNLIFIFSLYFCIFFVALTNKQSLAFCFILHTSIPFFLILVNNIDWAINDYIGFIYTFILRNNIFSKSSTIIT